MEGAIVDAMVIILAFGATMLTAGAGSCPRSLAARPLCWTCERSGAKLEG